MGIFSRPTTAQSAPGARARQLFIERNGVSVPSIAALPEQAAAVLGVPLSDLDEMEAIIVAHRLFGAAVEHTALATGRQGTAAAIDRVIETVGYDDDAIWDVVFAYGPGGVAIAEHVVSSYFESGTFARLLAEHLAENGGIQSYSPLPDPGRDDSEPEQIAWKIMSSLGLYYVICGEGSPHDLVDSVSRAIGDGRLGVSAPAFGQLDDDIRWCVYESSHGAALVLFPMVEPGSDLSSLIGIVDAFEALPAPWTCAVGKIGAVVPAGAAAIISDGHLVPMEVFDAVAPADVREQRRSIRASFSGGGVEAISGTLWKGVLPGAAERTQVVWFSLGERLRIMSPILTAPTIPDWLAAHDFGRYELESFAPFVTLGLWVDYAAGVDGLRREAVTLARFADECEASLMGADSDAL